MRISTTLQETVRELRDFKVLKMGQNLHTNMEGFCRAGHHYNIVPTKRYAYGSTVKTM